jgi:hypothetical protein
VFHSYLDLAREEVLSAGLAGTLAPPLRGVVRVDRGLDMMITLSENCVNKI